MVYFKKIGILDNNVSCNFLKQMNRYEVRSVIL